MNLITLKCEKNQALLGKHQLPLPDLKEVPQQIIFGIRPEDVSLASPESETAIMGQAYLVEQLGKDNLVSLRVRDSEITIRALLASDTDWQDKTIPLDLQLNKIHWFDIQTGERVN